MSASSGLSSSSFNEYNAQLQGAALRATRAAISLPADLSFHRTVHPEFGKELDRCAARVLSLTNKLLHLSSTANESTSTSTRGKGKARLETQDDVADNFHSLVVDAMDQLLEHADIGLDDFLGHSKPHAIAVNPTTLKKKSNHVAMGRLDPALQHASHLPKPQLTFKRKVDNSNHTVWTPSLRHKYNAQVPLGYDLEGGEWQDTLAQRLHPYRYEIEHLSYPSRMFTSIPPVSPRSFEETPFAWVSTSEAFATMLDKLRGASEIAVDLEHHSYRTFAGFVCLMQISTRQEDFVVDTLALRDDMEELNEVFTNPNIVKVLHGAESDIVWFQQDFDLYIVNLFDTYHASKVLDFPRHGLAALLEMYCDYTADKRYQLADWRIRPLPEEMLQYARSDTHFLLFIYDNLRNALLDRAQSRAQSPSTSTSTPPPDSFVASHLLVREVLSRSEKTALRVYEKEVYDVEWGIGPGGWDTLALKWNKPLLMRASTVSEPDSAARVQQEVFKAAHAWRDQIAREEDESTRYVLPNHYLFSLAERMPGDMAGLLAVFHPVPPVIRRRAKGLLDAIRGAVKEALRTTSASAAEPQTVAGSTAMSVDELQLSAPAVVAPLSTSTSSSSLWSNVASITATSSMLFGNTLTSNVLTVLPVAAQSSLLGARLSAPRRDAVRNRARFLEAATRIHSSLTIAPTGPTILHAKVVSDSTGPAHVNDLDDKNVLKNEGTMEMPFVPSSQRTRAAAPIDDSIVVVGQAKPKKRKRQRPGEKTAPTAQSGKEEPEEVEAFDYTSVPNILDDEAPHEASAKKKHRQSKGSNFYGNFPAPPKAHSQTKSGNQSRTFR